MNHYRYVLKDRATYMAVAWGVSSLVGLVFALWPEAFIDVDRLGFDLSWRALRWFPVSIAVAANLAAFVTTAQFVLELGEAHAEVMSSLDRLDHRLAKITAAVAPDPQTPTAPTGRRKWGE